MRGQPFARGALGAGDLLRAARRDDDLTIEALAIELGVSTPFLYDVERGSRVLTFARWGDLFKALPSLDPKAFIAASLRSGPVKLDFRDATEALREDLTKLLTRAAKAAA